MKIISPQEAKEMCVQGAILIDIRETAEYRREHISNAISIPLSQLQEKNQFDLTPNTTVIFHCKSGVRTKQAEAQLNEFAQTNNFDVYLLENGIDGWKQAGLETIIDRSQPIGLMRQVQITAGSFVLLGTILGTFIHPLFYSISAFIGAGLIFAGVTGFCGMARLLAKMPWNK
ncbi:rhodanese family protein [Ursidibacter sp. B-7004-1]